ncbi:hypothetical protein [Streptomyces sp. NBC_01497]|uniref:hypothetical protein n=1 Tax=Streptomyces sp. NBC_01497 TaxID=2903885 RepID=UPI002E353C0E|nr:hypothetical protein [Streptomyces sp. NBC_01497]
MDNFPDDLVQTQYAFNATYEALAAPLPIDPTGLRRRLLLLSARLWWHPYWTTVSSAPTARSELRRLVRPRSPEAGDVIPKTGWR